MAGSRLAPVLLIPSQVSPLLAMQVASRMRCGACMYGACAAHGPGCLVYSVAAYLLIGKQCRTTARKSYKEGNLDIQKNSDRDTHHSSSFSQPGGTDRVKQLLVLRFIVQHAPHLSSPFAHVNYYSRGNPALPDHLSLITSKELSRNSFRNYKSFTIHLRLPTS